MNGSELMNGVGPTPVLHTINPVGMVVPSFSSTAPSVTRCTIPLTIFTPPCVSLLAAYFRSDPSKLPRSSFASISVTFMSAQASGCALRIVSRMKLASSPANSTPVGPPPTITVCSNFFLSSRVREGTLASATFVSNRSRMRNACVASRSGNVCSSTPGTPNVVPSAPVQTASLSNFTSYSWPSAHSQTITFLATSTPFAFPA
mmetsp:Transcript_12227/g.32473  ORF Transcript_12227/g.32473 Transcript_12227/m.32473 type:complete len:203 (+) Transcript_12227:1535-2143(+)